MKRINLIYGTSDSRELVFDLYTTPSCRPLPALVYIHGGGWSEGDKEGIVPGLTSFGYQVASINYRMYPSFRFPAMIEDVKKAIRFLRAHACEFNIDPEKIALVGHSAGGHLASLAGLADEKAHWDVGSNLDVSSSVQAVVSISGPSGDLTKEQWPENIPLLMNVFGEKQLTVASPVNYAGSDSPPFLLIHGDADPVVKIGQSRILYDALSRAGRPVEFVVVKRGSHSLEPIPPETSVSPGLVAILFRTASFLMEHLEGKGKIRQFMSFIVILLKLGFKLVFSS